MSMEDLEYGFKLIEGKFLPEERTIGTQKHKEVIEIAENLLGVKLPYTYKLFLNKYGFGGVGSFIISGLRAENLEGLKTTGVVWKNLNKRVNFQHPKHLIEIEEVGEGTTYCLDTSQMNEEGECPVVAWPLGGYEETPALEIVAEDFGKFFLNMVQQQIESKKDAAS